MKALVLEAYDNLVYQEVDKPVISGDDVLVRVMACGICGSDIHGMDGSTGRRIPPLIMGHEASGVIEEVGGNVAGWQVGDRVTFDSTVYPMDDWFTANGQYNLSDGREVIGVSPGDYKRHGAFAEYVAIPQHILYRLPDNVTYEEAAMVEPIAVAQHCINLSGVSNSDSVVVLGSGMIGSFIIKLLNLMSVEKILAIDLVQGNLDKAVENGANQVFIGNDDQLITKVKSSTDGRGPDMVFDAVGVESSINSACEMVRKGGTVMLLGNLDPKVNIPLQKIVTGEILLKGSCAINGEYEEVLKLLSEGKIDAHESISVVAPLEEGADWFNKLKAPHHGLGKVILTPDHG